MTKKNRHLLSRRRCPFIRAEGSILCCKAASCSASRFVDYEILSIPMLLAVDSAEAKVRNLRIVDTKTQTMFPDEFMRYDSFTIREALHNCIAHQVYTMGARIEFVDN